MKCCGGRNAVNAPPAGAGEAEADLTANGAANYSRLSRIALNLLKRDQSVKVGIKAKRLNAGWDHQYLMRVISQ